MVRIGKTSAMACVDEAAAADEPGHRYRQPKMDLGPGDSEQRGAIAR